MGIETRRAGDEFPGGVPAEIILPLLTKSMAEISADGEFFDDRGGVRDVGTSSSSVECVSRNVTFIFARQCFVFAASENPVDSQTA